MFEYIPVVFLDLPRIPGFELGGARVHIVPAMPVGTSNYDLLVNDGWEAVTCCYSLIIQNWRIQPDFAITETENKMIATICPGAF